MISFALATPVLAETAFKNGDTIPSGKYEGIIIPNKATVNIKSSVSLESDSTLCLGNKCTININKNGFLKGENIRLSTQNWENCKFTLNKKGRINLSFSEPSDADTFVSILKNKIKYSRNGNTITAGKIKLQSTGTTISEGNVLIIIFISAGILLVITGIIIKKIIHSK